MFNLRTSLFILLILLESNQVIKIKKLISKLSSTDSRILISGPTGSGKELLARKIHKNSQRKKSLSLF